MKIIYETIIPEVAEKAVKCGVDTLMVDMEYCCQANVSIDKAISAVSSIKTVSNGGRLRVVVTPTFDESMIAKILAIDVDEVFLSGWNSVNEIERFVSALNNQVRSGIVLDSKENLSLLDEALKFNIEMAYIKTSSISDNCIEESRMIADGTIEAICNKVKEKNIEVGFGGAKFIKSYPNDAELLVAMSCKVNTPSILLRCTQNDTSVSVCSKYDPEEIAEGVKFIRENENKWMNATDDMIQKECKWIINGYLVKKQELFDEQMRYMA